MKHFCFVTGLYKRTDPLIFARQGKSLVDAGFKVTYIVCDLEKDEIKAQRGHEKISGYSGGSL